MTIPFFPGGRFGEISFRNLDLMREPRSKAVSEEKVWKRSSLEEEREKREKNQLGDELCNALR